MYQKVHSHSFSNQSSAVTLAEEFHKMVYLTSLHKLTTLHTILQVLKKKSQLKGTQKIKIQANKTKIMKVITQNGF